MTFFMTPVSQTRFTGRFSALFGVRRNLGGTERLLSGIAGTALLLRSLEESGWRSGFMALFGAALYARAFTGNSRLYELLGHPGIEAPSVPAPEPESPASGGGSGGIRVERTFLVHRPVPDVYRAWRNFENLPHFMTHLERVIVTGPVRSRWITKAPETSEALAWDAEIIEERPDRWIVWRSLPGAAIEHSGEVAFRPLGGSTEIHIVLAYSLPGGRPGPALARLFRDEPGRQIDADLLRFKHMMEVAG